MLLLMMKQEEHQHKDQPPAQDTHMPPSTDASRRRRRIQRSITARASSSLTLSINTPFLAALSVLLMMVLTTTTPMIAAAAVPAHQQRQAPLAYQCQYNGGSSNYYQSSSSAGRPGGQAFASSSAVSSSSSFTTFSPFGNHNKNNQNNYNHPAAASSFSLHAASKTSSSDFMSNNNDDQPQTKKRKSGWDRFKGVMNTAQRILASEDAAIFARGARSLLKEIDIDIPKMEDNLANLRRGVNQALSRTVLSMETLLTMYEGRSPEADKIINMMRGRVTKMVRGGLKKLLSDNSIHYALYAVNCTVVLVEEQAARVMARGRAGLESAGGGGSYLFNNGGFDNELTFEEVQREVMKRMVVVAEDAEALAWGIIGSRWFRSGYSEEDLVQFEALLNSRLVPRLVLTVAAAVLHGWKPLEDPLLALMVVGYASGSLTKSVAGTFMSMLEESLLGGEASLRSEGYLMDSLPDIWRTPETSQEIGEGLFRLFEVLEKKSSTRVAALAVKAREAAAAVGGGGGGGGEGGGEGGRMYVPPLPPPEKKFMVSSYSLPGRLAALSGGGSEEDGGGGGSMARPTPRAFYPAFESTREGKTLLYLCKSVHLTRTYWKEAAVTMLGAMGVVVLAKVFGLGIGSGGMAALPSAAVAGAAAGDGGGGLGGKVGERGTGRRVGAGKDADGFQRTVFTSSLEGLD